MQNQPANNPSGGTFNKIDVIACAYSQLRISGLTVTPTPEDLEVALDRLESMAAEWFERNIKTGWNFEDQPDPNSASGVKRAYKQAFETNLAVRLIPDFNKAVPPVLMMQANQSLSNLSARSAYQNVKGVTYPSRQPLGSGNTLRYHRWNRFYSGYGDQSASAKTINMFIGDVENFTEHFDAYIGEGDSIQSVELLADGGLDIQSDSFTDVDVSYQIKASGAGESVSSTRQLTIVVTADSGRVTTRIIYFSISSRPRVN